MQTTVFQRGALSAYARQISTPSLGDHSYLVIVGDAAVIVDPQRDVDRFDAALRASGARLLGVLETHIHNDYVSGGAALAARHAARYYLPAGSDATVPAQPLADEEPVALGAWRLRALATPGHTPHHAAYALEGPGGPLALFSGGSMLVGAAGRSDLLGPDWTDTLTRLQFHSVRRLAERLPDATSVQPTHGAGSFCVSGAGSETLSTIGRERQRNPALLAPDADAFHAAHLHGLPLFPAYYPRMAPINRRGADAPPAEPLPVLAPAALAALPPETWVIDTRDAEAFAAAHLPRSLNIPLGDDTATYAGWVVPWGAPLALVTASAHDLAHLRTDLARIGIDDRVEGAVTDGLAAWRASGGATETYRVADFAALAASLATVRPGALLDVRDPTEHAAGALPGARNVHVSEVLAAAADLPTGEIWVHCASGFRASIAASLLARLGRRPVLVAGSLDAVLAPAG